MDLTVPSSCFPKQRFLFKDLRLESEDLGIQRSGVVIIIVVVSSNVICDMCWDSLYEMRVTVTFGFTIHRKKRKLKRSGLDWFD